MCSGSEIMGEARTSSTVMGSRYMASGLVAALARASTAIRASCSDVVPYSCMWRWPRPGRRRRRWSAVGGLELGRTLHLRTFAEVALRAQLAAQPAQLVRAIRDEDRVAQPGLDRGRGVSTGISKSTRPSWCRR